MSSFGAPRTSSAKAPKRGMPLNGKSQFKRSATECGLPGSSRSGNQVPNGRVEMLLWLEAVSGRSVDSIERLRDGISYFIVLTDIIANCPDISVARHIELVHDTSSKVMNAPLIPLGDFPAQDSIQVIGACEKNLQVLQGLIRSTLPKKCAFEMDTTRMAKGIMQDHMVFLRWLVALPKKLEVPGTTLGVSGAGSLVSAVSRSNVPVRSKQQSSAAPSSPMKRGKSLGNSTARNPTAKTGPSCFYIDKDLLEILSSIEKEVTNLETTTIKAPRASPDVVQELIKERDTLSDLLVSIAGIIEEEEIKRGLKGCECPLREELIRTVYE